MTFRRLHVIIVKEIIRNNETHVYRFESEKKKLAWKYKSIHSGKEFRTNRVRLHVQFRSFVLNQQHFVDQAFKFATAFLYEKKS